MPAWQYTKPTGREGWSGQAIVSVMMLEVSLAGRFVDNRDSNHKLTSELLMSSQVTGGALLIDCLLEQGVDTVFGVPGESYLPALDALGGAANRVRTVMCRNEGGASFMAEAYAKLTGRVGICFVTRGPGATNASIGIHTARQDSIPLILFVGQVGRGARGREAFQEIDYKTFFGGIAKWVTEINDVNRIPEVISRAFHVAMNGRRGPVVVTLPEDVLSDLTDRVPARRMRCVEPEVGETALAEMFSLLANAQRPLVVVGGSGWSEAGRADLKRFAEANQLPVLAAFRFQDILDNHSTAYVGDAGVGMTAATRQLLSTADLIVAIGARLGEMTTEDYTVLKVPDSDQKLVHVYVDASELGKVFNPTLPIISSANHFVARAAHHRAVAAPVWCDWSKTARVDFLASLVCPAQPGGVDMGVVMAWLRDNLPSDAILTNGAGNFTIWPSKYFLYGPAARLLAPQSGAMGYGIPAAVAAKLVAPERVVVCFAGDGDFQMNGQELATAAQHGAQPIVLILNNSMYGTIRMHQERHYPGRVHGTDLSNPDFVKLADAYGYHGERVTSTAAFPAAFERARAASNGAVLELVIDPEALTPRMTLSQIRAAAQSSETP